ncbi:isoamyl acetate-hydrolyzing esterase [Coemansia sp. RSA 989]|nr:SGNH hydrolase-type esterase domain-containing protein [Coemansia mojavensis]KAJ1753622.1 isoamyl acetate-hydrolyzing esterase [Coemansia sp. RSA 1821]KAJ1868557.1 isoamyl acetate-hydrolyzing esterase [Coemansia sp. RSA 989]KAJ1876167.1 isoamyl acetate-hydrolyzing esterase [Coemansia sp. RSA 990]KAJ2633984.1 isoamyl acetate-hydrolyzing esterase [Coemansia sp. RSA 1290]KAJ2652322.1 isoamyl acetate-hydrolyzing esterase [Coemansia sp. RSA 1250]KAJ2675849.1 isoamyl acetate-hydrolyzing esterase
MAFSRTTIRTLVFVLVVLLFIFNYVSLTYWIKNDFSSDVSVYNEYEYPTYDVLIAFGDSITQIGDDPDNSGYLTHLTRYYERQMDVLNRGFSGFNTSKARSVVHRVFPKTREMISDANSQPNWFKWFSKTKRAYTANSYANSKKSLWPTRSKNYPGTGRKLQLCIIAFGANDAQHKRYTGHNPISTYEADLRYFVWLLWSPESEYYSPNTRILFITPPATGNRMIQAKRRKEYMPIVPNSQIKAYAEVVKKVATDVNTPYVDLYSAIESRVHSQKKRQAQLFDIPDSNNTFSARTGAAEYDGYDEFLVDGLHLNPAGNRLLFNLITATINQTWPELKPSKPIWATPPK